MRKGWSVEVIQASFGSLKPCSLFFIAEMKKLELADKYAELKRSGKLESFLSKKRKRNAIKDKRHLPSQKNL